MARLLVAILALLASACTTQSDVVTVYSGREESLVAPLFEDFTEATGVEVEVRYGDSAALAAQILEEGDGSPADVFFAQDGGALGAVSDLLVELDAEVLERVPEGFRSDDGLWVGTSGRARTVVYNTDRLNASDLPPSILDFTDPAWEGRVGWAPTNGSFQAAVTAMRVLEGENVARAWLEGMKQNAAVDYPKNSAIVAAVAAGEVDAGFVNHYYLLQMLTEEPDAPAANLFLSGDVGGLVNVAGAGILASAPNPDEAAELLDFLTGIDAQTYFATETFEYPLIAGVEPDERLPSLAEIDPPAIDLSDLADLQGTLELLAEVGVV